MPSTLRGSMHRSVFLCLFLAAAFGLLAATPNAGQTGPLSGAVAGSRATPISVHGATVTLAQTCNNMPFGTNGVGLVVRGKGAVHGSGVLRRVQQAGRTLQSRSPRYPWVCLMCHLPASANL